MITITSALGVLSVDPHPHNSLQTAYSNHPTAANIRQLMNTVWPLLRLYMFTYQRSCRFSIDASVWAPLDFQVIGTGNSLQSQKSLQ